MAPQLVVISWFSGALYVVYVHESHDVNSESTNQSIDRSVDQYKSVNKNQSINQSTHTRIILAIIVYHRIATDRATAGSNCFGFQKETVKAINDQTTTEDK